MEHEEIVKRFRIAHSELSQIEVILRGIRHELDLAGQAFKQALDTFDKVKQTRDEFKAPDETI